MTLRKRFFWALRASWGAIGARASRSWAWFISLAWLVSSVVRGQVRFTWFGKTDHSYDSLVVEVLASGFAETALFQSQHFAGRWRPLRETPHYKFARGTIEKAPDARSSYEEYMIQRRSRTPQDLKRKSANFSNMINAIREGSEMPPVVVRLKPGFLGIVDGSHRMAAYAALRDLNEWHGRVPFVLTIGGARHGGR